MPSAPRSHTSAARIVYAGIVASTLIIIVGALTLSLTLGNATAAAGLADGVALVFGAATFSWGFRLRARLRQPTARESVDDWWNANTGRVLLMWGLMELTAIAGAVVTFATGHLTAFVALAVLGLAGLGTLAPGRVAGR